jgi:glycosyltransferase involved in cell wall biosynthesis
VDNANVIAIGGGTAHGPRTLTVWRATLEAIRATQHERRFHVLHAFWATESGLLASVAGRVLGIPVLISLAGGELVRLPSIGYGDQRSAWERLKVRACLSLATRISAGSKQLVRRAQAYLQGKRAVTYAPLGVDRELFRPSQVEPRDAFLHVGALTPVKDQQTLLRAFAAVQASATLDIAGDGALRDSLGRLACELGVDNRVQFVGAVDHADLPALYRGSRALVLSSCHEAQGMVVLEAAACGVATVGTNVGIVPELAPDAARMVQVGDAAALTTALEDVLRSPQQSQQLGRAARARVDADFGLATCVDRFRGLYGQLVAA